MLHRFRRLLALSAVGVGLWFVVHVGNDVLRQLESDAPSESVGQTNNGSLVNGKRLPSSGPGFATYSRLGSLLGRTATHHRVRDAILDAYAAVHAEHPEVTLIYGETGWPSGGSFRPHRTHQNGLSVDFMVPVLRAGEPDVLPTHPFNTWGYGVDFDDDGQNGDLAIDFEMLAEHLHQLDLAARANASPSRWSSSPRAFRTSWRRPRAARRSRGGSGSHETPHGCATTTTTTSTSG